MSNLLQCHCSNGGQCHAGKGKRRRRRRRGCSGGLGSSIGHAAELDTHSRATDSIVQCSTAIN